MIDLNALRFFLYEPFFFEVIQSLGGSPCVTYTRHWFLHVPKGAASLYFLLGYESQGRNHPKIFVLSMPMIYRMTINFGGWFFFKTCLLGKLSFFSPKKNRMYINRLQLGPPPHPSILWFGANTITITESTGKQGAGVLPQGFRMKYCWWFRNPARKPVEVGSFSHYLQGFSTIPGGDRRIFSISILIARWVVFLRTCLVPPGGRGVCWPQVCWCDHTTNSSFKRMNGLFLRDFMLDNQEESQHFIGQGIYLVLLCPIFFLHYMMICCNKKVRRRHFSPWTNPSVLHHSERLEVVRVELDHMLGAPGGWAGWGSQFMRW